MISFDAISILNYKGKFEILKYCTMINLIPLFGVEQLYGAVPLTPSQSKEL
ncbi:hypothetical protein J5TS2_23400 [Brevibacillus halotolerans]|nr:hypothetical protein J5TS2_23400 [Brevibacillus halotolerans]